MIMPNIRISDWNKSRLEELGRFGDNHDSVLGRSLDLILSDRRLADKVRAADRAQTQTPNPIRPDGRPVDARRRARAGTVTGERFFIKYILSVLKDAKEHSMHCGEVLREL